MRLIDADAIEHCLVIGGRRHGKTIISEIIRRAIQTAPTVDAVPVIRCKDCKFWQLEHYVGGQGMSCQIMDSDDVSLTEPTHFCGWAERKEE